MLFILFNIYLVQGTITYEQGQFQEFNSTARESFICKDGYEESQVISFSDSFNQPPKIILTRNVWNMEAALNQKELQFQFNISDVTTTSFTLYIQCGQLQIFTASYYWFAITDDRVEVINQFNVTNFQDQTFEHKNPNAMSGIISILNIGFKGPFSFNISISSITPNTVRIAFSDPLKQIGNILSLGYQIILASKQQLSVYYLSAKKQFQSSTTSTSMYTSKYFFLVPTSGYEYLNKQNLNLAILIDWNSQSFKVDSYSTPFINHTIFIADLYYNVSEVFLPLFCNHIHVKQWYNISSPPSTSIQLLILEINNQFLYPGQYTVALDQTLVQINFQFTVNCLETQYIESLFYIQDQLTKSISQSAFQHNCTSKYHIFTFYSRFKQQNLQYYNESIQIDVASNYLIINQLLFNSPNIAKQQLVNIQVLDQ